jgi:hypothetical protein
MHREHDLLAYVRLNNLAGNRRGNNLRGELQFVSADDRAESGFTAKRASISGSQSGNSLLLETDGLFGLDTKQLYGTLAGGRLSLNFPSDAGRIEKLVFVSASEDQWNGSLAAFARRRAREVADLRRRQARAAAIEQLQGRLQSAQADQAQAEQEMGELKSRIPTDERERGQADEKLAAARHLLDRARELRHTAGERLSSSNRVADEARALAQQSNSAGSREVVEHARQSVEAAASMVQEVAAEIQREASAAARGEPSTDADLDAAQQTLDAAIGQLTREEAALRAPHDRPDEDTQSQIESAAGAVESAAGQVESAVGAVESAVGQVESAIGDVEGQVERAESVSAEARAKAADDAQGLAVRQERVRGDKSVVQDCISQLRALGWSPGMNLLAQYAAAIHWFDPHISPSMSWRLSQAVVVASQRCGVDARLVLAIAEEEGSLRELGSGSTRTGGRTADSAFQAVAQDLRRRLKHIAGPGAQSPTAQQLARMLVERYKSHSGASSEAARHYSQNVARLYYEMCGAGPEHD